MKLIENYLLEIQRPDVLYHARWELVNVIKPNVSDISTAGKIKTHGKNAIFASSRKLYAFGLERVNLLTPYKYTEQEVERWKKASWLSPQPPLLILYYWNHIPKKPIYLYKLDPKGFKPFKVISKGKTYYHWYIEKPVKPLSVKKIYPREIKNIGWKVATDRDWEIKKQKYRDRGAFKK